MLQPLRERSYLALKAAVEKVFIDHARRGLPLYIWRDGKTVELFPEEVKAEAARMQAE